MVNVEIYADGIYNIPGNDFVDVICRQVPQQPFLKYSLHFVFTHFLLLGFLQTTNTSPIEFYIKLATFMFMVNDHGTV